MQHILNSVLFVCAVIVVVIHTLALIQSFVSASRRVIMMQASSPQCRKEGKENAQCSNTGQQSHKMKYNAAMCSHG